MWIYTNPALPGVTGSAVASHSTGDIVDIFESMLFENTGAKTGTISRAADQDDCFIPVQFIMAGSQIRHRDIDGPVDMVIQIFQTKMKMRTTSIQMP